MSHSAKCVDQTDSKQLNGLCRLVALRKSAWVKLQNAESEKVATKVALRKVRG